MIKAACQLTSECASVQALTGAACGPAIDVWSLGCVLAEVALQRPLFPATSAAELMQQVQHCWLKKPSEMNHNSYDI